MHLHVLVLQMVPELAETLCLWVSNVRKVGFQTVGKLFVGPTAPGTPAARSGLRPEDQITAVNGSTILTPSQLFDAHRRWLPAPRSSSSPHSADAERESGPGP